MSNRTDIEARLKLAREEVAIYEAALLAVDDLLENNVFDSHTDAEYSIEERYRGIASDACEGSYCMGADRYTQDYKVAGEVFTAHMTVEYNRHDKQYYYVDGFRYRFEPKAPSK